MGRVDSTTGEGTRKRTMSYLDVGMQVSCKWKDGKGDNDERTDSSERGKYLGSMAIDIVLAVFPLVHPVNPQKRRNKKKRAS